MSKKIAEPVTVAGKDLACLVCGNGAFYTRKAQLNTRTASFFDLDFLNKNADCHICETCGHVHWFLPRS